MTDFTVMPFVPVKRTLRCSPEPLNIAELPFGPRRDLCAIGRLRVVCGQAIIQVLVAATAAAAAAVVAAAGVFTTNISATYTLRDRGQHPDSRDCRNDYTLAGTARA